MAIYMLKIRRPLGRLIFNMGIAIPGKTVFLIETAPWWVFISADIHCDTMCWDLARQVHQMQSIWVMPIIIYMHIGPMCESVIYHRSKLDDCEWLLSKGTKNGIGENHKWLGNNHLLAVTKQLYVVVVVILFPAEIHNNKWYIYA